MTFEIEGGFVDVIAVEDLVRAKQTQRDRDWPVIARLVDVAYFAAEDSPTGSDIDFFIRALRTPETLTEAVARFPETATDRAAEQDEAQKKDRQYWEPLKRELGQFRHELRRVKT